MKKLDSCPCAGESMPRFVQPVLLALLARESMYGYALMQKLEELDLFAGGSPDVAGIYRKLNEMGKNGVLEICAESSDKGPQRKRYSITPLGLDCLERWILTLGKTRTHLDGVLKLTLETRAATGASLPPFATATVCACATSTPKTDCACIHCPEEDKLFLQQVYSRALAGIAIEREAIVRMLSWDPDSPQVAELGRLARDMARQVAGNTATVWTAIGVDCVPCSMNCSFCSFGAKWGVIKHRHEWSKEQILAQAEEFVRDGAAWIILRTTEHYGEERLRTLLREVKAILPPGVVLAANTSQLSLPALEELKKTGTEAVYHSLRLGEGRDTPFDPEERRLALNRIARAGFMLAHLVEPLGVEHSNEEIADVFLAAWTSGAGISGVMARSNIPGTPFGEAGTLSEKRLAQITAMTRLCGGRRMPHICVHPPLPQAVEWGANVVVVETGAVPRDTDEVQGEWQAFTVANAKKLFADHGYQVTNRIY